MTILGIETSCDETAIAVIDIGSPSTNPVRNGISNGASSGDIRVKVLANIVSSQAKLHAKFGGVVPNLAKREHQKNLVPVLKMALRAAGLVCHSEGVSPTCPPKPLPVPLARQTGRRRREAGRPKNLRDPSLALRMTTVGSILAREPELFTRMAKRVLPLAPPAIDAIAVTVGPGLAPALWVGVNFARALAYLWDKPLVPVNHLEGHIYTNLLSQVRVISNFQFSISKLRFPALCLIVSGGHTELVLMKGYGKYKIIGETLDDAAGEAFDKVAKMMRMGFPGGPAIARQAEQWKSQIANRKFQTTPRSQILNSKQTDKLGIKFPRPMINSKDFNFSFSGLKTAVLYFLGGIKGGQSIAKIRPCVAAEFQQAVVDVLIAKTIRAAGEFKAKTVMIGGGVAANQKLRKELGEALARERSDIRYLIPDIRLTGDNALMIALAGYFCRNKKAAWRNLQADANLRLGRS